MRTRLIAFGLATAFLWALSPCYGAGGSKLGSGGSRAGPATLGSYYRLPGSSASVPINPRSLPAGSYQTLPGGLPAYNSPVRPMYERYQGKYSPSPQKVNRPK